MAKRAAVGAYRTDRTGTDHTSGNKASVPLALFGHFRAQCPNKAVCELTRLHPEPAPGVLTGFIVIIEYKRSYKHTTVKITNKLSPLDIRTLVKNHGISTITIRFSAKLPECLGPSSPQNQRPQEAWETQREALQAAS